jgi:hypothetical protein
MPKYVGRIKRLQICVTYNCLVGCVACKKIEIFNCRVHVKQNLCSDHANQSLTYKYYVLASNKVFVQNRISSCNLIVHGDSKVVPHIK